MQCVIGERERDWDGVRIIFTSHSRRSVNLHITLHVALFVFAFGAATFLDQRPHLLHLAPAAPLLHLRRRLPAPFLSLSLSQYNVPGHPIAVPRYWQAG